MKERLETLYTVAEVAKHLKVSVKTMHNKISAREITAYSGRPVLIPASAIVEYLRQRRRRAV